MAHNLYVFNDHAYARPKAFERAEKLAVCFARKVGTLEHDAALVYRVEFDGQEIFATDPVEVARVTRGHADAIVTVISVIH